MTSVEKLANSSQEDAGSSSSSTKNVQPSRAANGIALEVLAGEGALVTHQGKDKHSATEEELEFERAKRRELEETVAVMKAQQQQQKQKQLKSNKYRRKSGSHKDTNSNSARKDLIALQAEVQGYRQLVDVMTLGRPAMVAATTAIAEREPNALPPHIIRFLELMPWHPEARRAAVVTEVLYEWQVYHPGTKSWRSDLVHFPSSLLKLPLAWPIWNGRELDTSKTGGGLSLPKTNDQEGMWTDRNLTHRLELRDGYRLPEPGPNAPRWKWVGGWKVVVDDDDRDTDDDSVGLETSRTTKEDKVTAVDEDTSCHCDPDGWTYAKRPCHFLDDASSEDASGLMTPYLASIEMARIDHTRRRWGRDDANDVNTSLVRRRQWNRTRVLAEYPGVSEYTQNYLKLIFEQEERDMEMVKLQKKRKQDQQAFRALQAEHSKERQTWITERRTLESQKQALEVLLQRQKVQSERDAGPHHQDFVGTPATTPVSIQKFRNSDDDIDSVNENDDGLSQCSSVTRDGENERTSGRHLILNPENEALPRKPSLFGWIQQHQQKEKDKQTLTSHKGRLLQLNDSPNASPPETLALPDIEVCSDESSQSESPSMDRRGSDGSIMSASLPGSDAMKMPFLSFSLFQK